MIALKSVLLLVVPLSLSICVLLTKSSGLIAPSYANTFTNAFGIIPVAGIKANARIDVITIIVK